MKIAIPSETDQGLQSMRSGHFGHTPYFTIVEIEDGEVKNVEAVKNIDHDQVGCGGVIDFAISLGIDGIIVAGMGRPPFMRFTDAGIDVYFETQSPYVMDCVEHFLAGTVPAMKMDDACNHH